MTQPTVACIMLVNERGEMVKRAVRSFEAQTYPNKKLLIWDTGCQTLNTPWFDEETHPLVGHVLSESNDLSIGDLRNEANAFWNAYPIICHWDSDDWSHPNRIAEQVALLQSSGKQCVGYRDMLFCEEVNAEAKWAWLYTNPDQRYCLGTSLCYWRSVWEARPFPDLPKPGKERGGVGEDTKWLEDVDSLGVSSMQAPIELSPEVVPPEQDGYNKPRMIASIHGANTQYYNPAEYVARQQGTSWKRAAEFDDYCRERMVL